MHKIFALAVIQLSALVSIGQQVILPGDKSIDESIIKPGLTTMGYFLDNNGQIIDVGTYEIEISTDYKKITVNSILYFKNSEKQWKDVCVVDADNYKPVSYSSDRDDRSFNISFANSVRGEFLNKKSKEKKAINESPKGKYFDINIYPHILRALPLGLGYKAIIPVYDYEAEDKGKVYNVSINQVKSDVYSSALTGKHNVWRVSVFEESTGHKFDYLIDKESRRLWQIHIISKEGQFMSLSDKESDYNPLKQKFDKEATVKLISKGKSTITGQVFGRANKNDESWVTAVNWNPKQFARKGTAVYLIPYTIWYKEYFEVNRQLRKDGRKYNMPKEALECILVSRIFDDKGHFEFVNIMPGEYIVYSQFQFFEKHHEDIVVGSQAVFQGNIYLGTQDITQRNRWSQLEYAFSEAFITITKDGEMKEVKMKKDKKSRFF
jgi:hypothetical protein